MTSQSDEYKKAVQETQVFYDKLAPYYDEFVPPHKMRTKRISSLVSYIREKLPGKNGLLRILELGCGTGSYAIPLARNGHIVTGVDISEKMRDVAIGKLNGSLPQNLEYLTADWLTAMDRWKAEYDCVLCIGNSLSHNPSESLHDLFAGVFHVLKPGGIFIVNSRRIEQELNMSEGPDSSQQEVCRSGGPACIPGIGTRNVLKYMFMTKLVDAEGNRTVLTFYTYDNYEQDKRRFVHHRMVFNNDQRLEIKPLNYDSWSTRQYFIYEEPVIALLKNCGFSEVKEESPDPRYFGLDKNWYIVARKLDE